MKLQQLIIKHAFLLILVFPVFAIANSTDAQNRLIADETLIVPGIGAEKILLGDTAQTVIARWGAPVRTVKLSKTEETFENIFSIKTDLKIPFDAIYYYGDGKGIFFIHQNIVSAIAGNARSRVTADAVPLDKGVQQFIFHYGNESLMTVHKGKHAAYCYPRKGIAVFDDDGNDGIDLYVVFRTATQP